jgi:uncharacterized protein (TIGR02246 family)
MANPVSLTMDEKFAIMELITRYNHAVDGGDPDGVADCFVEDGRFEGRSGLFIGRTEIRRLGMTVTSALLPRHIVSNILIELSRTERDVAHVKSHLFFYEVTPNGFHFKTSGIYTDVVVRRDEGWKFRSRRMTLDVAKPVEAS